MTTNPIRDGKAALTSATTQILFIDLQPEIVGGSKTNPPDGLIAAAVALARIGRLFDLPMVVSLVPIGEAEPRLVPELAAELEDVKPLVRTMAAVFDDVPTTAAIKANGRRDLVVCGVITEVAVLLACVGAAERGYEVHVPVDACGGTTSRTEDAAFRRLASLDATTAAVTTLGAMLAQDLASPRGIELMRILQPLMH